MSNSIHGCLVCERQAEAFAEPFAEPRRFSCPACGPYLATSDCCDDYGVYADFLRKQRNQVVIGHWLRRASANGKMAVLTIEKAEQLVQQGWLPSHTDQANNLIRFVGDIGFVGGWVVLNEATQIIVGTEHPKGIAFLTEELTKRGLCIGGLNQAKLTLDGWNAYDALKRGVATGTKAFMAMPFGQPDLDDTILPIARRAAKACGFDLQRLDDQPKPGIIDVQLRVAIQEARFAIVDLTHANLGAYWEAGYAEGLGKPVIYTVRADHDISAHFDVAHLSRIIWYEDKLDVAEKQIKAMIRNELPDAVHED